MKMTCSSRMNGKRCTLSEEARLLYEHGFRPAQIAKILYKDEWEEIQRLKRVNYIEYRRRYRRLVNRVLFLLSCGSSSSRAMTAGTYDSFELNGLLLGREELVLDAGWSPLDEGWARSDEWRDKPAQRKIRSITPEERWKVEYEEIMYNIYCDAGLYHYDPAKAVWLKARAIHEEAWQHYLDLLGCEAKNYYHKNKRRYPAQVVAYCYLCLASALLSLRVRWEAFAALKRTCVMYAGDERGFENAVEALSHLFLRYMVPM